MKKLIKVFVLVFVLNFFNAGTLFAAGPSGINLGASGNYAILTKTGISTTGTTSVVGDIGVSPAEATYITGFSLILPAGGAYSTSSLVTGKIYAPSYATPTPANISIAVSDMQTAYTDGAGRSLSAITELGAGNIGGMTLLPGLYKWGTGVTIPTDLILRGSANDVWIFIIAKNLDISSSKSIILSGGAKSNNIYWVVAGQTTIGTGSTFNGNILDQTAIVLNTGAVLNGRALAQTAVTLDANAVTISGGSSMSNSSTSAIPAVPTTPAVSSGSGSGNTISATHAVPASSSINSNNQVSNSNTSVGNIPQAYKFGLVTLKLWSKGEAVMELQRFLNAKLNLNLVIDGKLGPKTISVVKQWQKDNGLISDGLVGKNTKMKMSQ